MHSAARLASAALTNKIVAHLLATVEVIWIHGFLCLLAQQPSNRLQARVCVHVCACLCVSVFERVSQDMVG